MKNTKRLQHKVAWSLGALLLFASPVLADLETYEAPFTLNFGMDFGKDSGEGLLMTPSAAPFSLEADNLKLSTGHASAMAEKVSVPAIVEIPN
jgi:hypothetical protein